MRLIDADALQRKICGAKCGCEYEDCGNEGDCEFDHFIFHAPTIEAVVVTRCKNCKFSHADGHGRTCEGYWFELSEYAVSVKDDDFCSYGERRDDA